MASPPGARRKGKGASPRPWLQLDFKTRAFILVFILFSIPTENEFNQETLVFFVLHENLKEPMT